MLLAVGYQNQSQINQNCFIDEWYDFSSMLHNLQQVLFLFFIIADAGSKVLFHFNNNNNNNLFTTTNINSIVQLKKLVK